jgi:hypothetical protein
MVICCEKANLFPGRQQVLHPVHVTSVRGSAQASSRIGLIVKHLATLPRSAFHEAATRLKQTRPHAGGDRLYQNQVGEKR